MMLVLDLVRLGLPLGGGLGGGAGVGSSVFVSPFGDILDLSFFFFLENNPIDFLIF